MIRKIFVSALAFVLFISCSSSDGNVGIITDPYKIVSVKTMALTYDDIQVTGYNQLFSGKIYCNYDALDRISSVNGGFKPAGALTNFLQWSMSDDVVDLISYQDDIVYVQHSFNQMVKPYDKEFKYANGLIMSRKVISHSLPNFEPVQFTYEHAPNQIIEKRNGQTFRIFFMVNGNLVKIEHLGYDSATGEVNAKNDMLFLDYDNTPNYLRGKHFINGAFYRAFSNNNFKRIVYNSYTVDSDGNWVFQDQGHRSINFGYTNNVADIFEIDFD